MLERTAFPVMMDENELSNQSWRYYEPSRFGPNIGFQLIPTYIDRNEKQLVSSQNPNFISTTNGISFPRDYTFSDAPFMSYNWLNQHRDSKFFSNLPSHSLVVPETCRTQPMQHLQIPMPEVEESLKRRQCNGGEQAAPNAKKEGEGKDDNFPRMQRERSSLRKSIEMVINGVSMDTGCLPVPVCSCTGMSQLCYRWGCGGWQSACSTTNVSMHPLPMRTKRRGARIAGRKMSQCAFKKVLEKLSVDGFYFSNPIDLKSHWAKHGTNKFVTIK